MLRVLIPVIMAIIVGCKQGENQAPDQSGYCMIQIFEGESNTKFEVCNQYKGMVQDQMDEMANEKCPYQAEGNIGTWFTGTCPPEGRKGVCQFPQEDITVEQYYYTGFSLLSAEQSCDSTNGNWIN